MAQWDQSCDVLVVGSGAGGMMAAYTASREGMDVVLVESTDKFGGMSAYSGGGMWFPRGSALAVTLVCRPWLLEVRPVLTCVSWGL